MRARTAGRSAAKAGWSRPSGNSQPPRRAQVVHHLDLVDTEHLHGGFGLEPQLLGDPRVVELDPTQAQVSGAYIHPDRSVLQLSRELVVLPLGFAGIRLEERVRVEGETHTAKQKRIGVPR